MGFLKGVNAPGFFWVLLISLLSATTYKVEYGNVVFLAILVVFAGIKAYQMWREAQVVETDGVRPFNMADSGNGNGADRREPGKAFRFFLG